jgi:hypothetical protein
MVGLLLTFLGVSGTYLALTGHSIGRSLVGRQSVPEGPGDAPLRSVQAISNHADCKEDPTLSLALQLRCEQRLELNRRREQERRERREEDEARAAAIREQLRKQTRMEAQERKAEREQEAIEKREAVEAERQKRLREERKQKRPQAGNRSGLLNGLRTQDDESSEEDCDGPCQLRSEEDAGAVECHDAVDGEECFVSVNWAKDKGVALHPDWYPGLGPTSPFAAFQRHLHSLGLNNCSRPCRAKDEERRSMKFYVYRVQNETERPLENDIASSLAGILWYLHNEIVPLDEKTRLWNVSRIVRFKITVETTQEFFEATGHQFAPFAPFEDGRCTDPSFGDFWAKVGFVVGCRRLDRRAAAYGNGHDEGGVGSYPVAYSLPGPCPNSHLEAKSRSCSARWPGGSCSRATGGRNCTFSITPAGEISLDELMGIRDYHSFSSFGKREYVADADKGVGCTFWDTKHDARLCEERVDRVRQLFRAKYPELPACESLPEPACDAPAFEEVLFRDGDRLAAPTTTSSSQAGGEYHDLLETPGSWPQRTEFRTEG